ncbi:MAG: GTPase Era [Gammaproteobacteria bacterium]|nr:GTPase Era [Gammaproteobacteria bacterium]
MSETVGHCGYATILGRPNVGKSTLLNRILGQKVSITSPKPQTTRHRILGIKTSGASQVVYVDTPGLHRHAKRALNRYLNRAARGAVHDVDAIVFVTEALKWTDDDALVLDALRDVKIPVVLAVNKVDKVADKRLLLPHLKELSGKMAFAHVIPISAGRGDNVAVLEREVLGLMPVSPSLFPTDQITDRSERFLTAELIREQLTLALRDELPYSCSVEIDKFAEQDNRVHVHATLWVERPSQKAIVIGKDGAMLKKMGVKARQEIERLLDRKVFLQLWVKVKEEWADNERALRGLGYTE